MAASWLTLRLFKLAAMDFTVYRDLSFQTSASASSFLGNQPGVTSKRLDFATKYSANIMARAVVTRCSATLDKELIGNPPEHLGKLPELTQCAILKSCVEYGRLD